LRSWLSVNGEAIYGIRPWKVYGEGPTQVAGGSFSDAKDKPIVADDVRFTTKGDYLYAIALDNPPQALMIKNITPEKPGKIKSVELIGSKNKVNWSQTNLGLSIQPLPSCPTLQAVPFKIVVEK